ncbi:MAG: hypothetical protein A2589_03425 [Candidatus Vogelbacteria bacterium RIFOXYD1_FULL_46_19]|uniref:Uncharacterized protein n=1 Tax=Candidatus Vogelbacteria bacterium RIFOXYD1_FULL_46_19 TaxID=1802439 RepID=A0A1G2QF59_9BACT|nr:MAG: hypothetical protein A2589_03425 [Candidatus Vogelbacteria bacterium RIFOXYD1_FULL_46_19]
MSKKLIIGVLLVVIVLLGLTLWLGSSGAGETYQSTVYGYTFSYPADYELVEYQPSSLALGRRQGEEFEALVNVRLYTAGAAVGFNSYNDFVTDQLRNMCAADGPTETLYCTDIVERDSFMTDENFLGERLIWNRVHENFESGEALNDQWGPVYAFNFSHQLADPELAILSVEPAFYTGPEAEDLAKQVASSLEIVRTVGQTEERVALVERVEVVADASQITVDFVELLTGEVAKAAALADCEAAAAADCNQELEQDYYIRNQEVETENIKLTPETQIILQQEARPIGGTVAELEARLKGTAGPMLLRLWLRGGEGVRLEEVYLP